MSNFLSHLLLQCLLCTFLCAKANTIKAHFRSKNSQNLAAQFEAIYQFGDSLNDNGNYIRLPFGATSFYKSFPYGLTIHQPTGRASDGLVLADHIATYFHLPMLNPYLANGSNFTHGVNFAVASATANGGVGANSLAAQINWFKSHLISTYSTPTAIKEKLQKSLVIMGEIGGNDFNVPFSQRRTISEVANLIPGVINTIKLAIEEVINLGASNIVVPGNLAIGCVPLYLVQFATSDRSKYDELNCLKDYNEFANLFNEQLKQAIQNLQQAHPSVAIVYADYYNALKYVIANAPKLGIEQDGDKKVCCGEGNNPYNYDPIRVCRPGIQVCQDPNKRVSWDGIHMTQFAYKCVAEWLLKQIVPALEHRHHL